MEKHTASGETNCPPGKALGISGTGGDPTKLESLKTHRLGIHGLHWRGCLLNTNHATNVPYDGAGLQSGNGQVEPM